MKTKTKNLILVNIVSLFALLIPAIIFGKYSEAVIFFIAHWLIREQFSKQYHSIIPASCRIITGSVLFFGVCLSLPVQMSFVFCLPICYLISWVGFVKKTSDEFEVKNQRLEEKMEKLSKEINGEVFAIENKCKKANLSSRDTIIAKMYYIERKTPKDIWLWLCKQKEYEYIEWQSVHQLLWRIGKKIKTN